MVPVYFQQSASCINKKPKKYPAEFKEILMNVKYVLDGMKEFLLECCAIRAMNNGKSITFRRILSMMYSGVGIPAGMSNNLYSN